MLTASNIRNRYDRIQKQLFYMIPEKWDKVYLYASVLDHFNNLQTGEMFFYYYPKGVLRKNPVNVYEVPSKFNIDEKAYLKLAENLYKEIKELRVDLVKMGEKPWSNLTITIKDFKFNIEYSYEDLVNTKYTSYDRHLIWRYKYLEIPLSSYSKKEKNMIEEYIYTHKVSNVNTYQEGIYKKQVGNIIEYNKQEIQQEIQQETKQEDKTEIKNDENIQKQEKQSEVKSQILNLDFKI